MFKNNRCCERPMSYASESSYKYAMNDGKASEYPAAVPMGMADGMMMGGAYGMMGCQMPPVYECPQERVCHKEFVHNVPQE